MATQMIVISLSRSGNMGATFANIPVEVPCPDPVTVTDLSQATTRELIDELGRRIDVMGPADDVPPAGTDV